MAWLYTVLNPTKGSPVEFDGFGTVANAKHPWLGYTQSWIQQKQPVEFDRFGTVANAKHPWLGYTQSWIQQKQAQWSLMDLVDMATCSIRWDIPWSTESTKIHQNQQNQERLLEDLGVVWVKECSQEFKATNCYLLHSKVIIINSYK